MRAFGPIAPSSLQHSYYLQALELQARRQLGLASISISGTGGMGGTTAAAAAGAGTAPGSHSHGQAASGLAQQEQQQAAQAEAEGEDLLEDLSDGEAQVRPMLQVCVWSGGGTMAATGYYSSSCT